jgi:hypothetical protein
VVEGRPKYFFLSNHNPVQRNTNELKIGNVALLPVVGKINDANNDPIINPEFTTTS